MYLHIFIYGIFLLYYYNIILCTFVKHSNNTYYKYIFGNFASNSNSMKTTSIIYYIWLYIYITAAECMFIIL